MKGGCVSSLAARHRSIRAYSEPPTEDDLKAIIEAARRAPSAWNLQPYTITVVRDREKLARLAEAVGGQKHVAEAPVFLVFSVDLEKVYRAARDSGFEPSEPSMAHLLAALVDVGIAVGWAGLAAEDLGYGVAFIAVYSNPCMVAEIIGAPGHTLPAVGLTIGRPAEEPEVRPRQPLDALVGFDSYPDPARAAEGVASVYQDPKRFFGRVVARGGYFDYIKTTLLECALRRGFKV